MPHYVREEEREEDRHDCIFNSFGKQLERCSICSREHSLISEWKHEVANALEERQRAPQHPFLVMGWWTRNDYHRYMKH